MLSFTLSVRQLLGRTLTWLSRQTTASALFASLFVFGICCRLYVGFRLFSEDITPFSYVANISTLLQGLRFFVWDFFFALVLAGVSWGLTQWVKDNPKETFWRRLGVLVLGGALITIGVITGAHFDLVFDTHAGMTLEVILEAFSAGSLHDVLGYASPAVITFALLPLGLFLAFRWQSLSVTRLRGKLLLALGLLSIVFQVPSIVLWTFGRAPATPNFSLRAVPAYFVTQQVLSAVLLPTGEMRKQQEKVAFPRVTTSQLNAPIFLREKPLPAPLELIAAEKTEWNVVVIVMESTGSRYLKHVTPSGEIPMPFVTEIMGAGTNLNFHMATSNTSPRALFSIFSGLLPLPDFYMFCTRADVHLPGLSSFLDAEYTSFLVTPGRTQSYFPLSFMHHSGMTDIEDYYSLPQTERPAWPGGRHEFDAVDRFIERLDQTQEPFFGTYYSYAPHYHYYDYGPDYQIEPGNDPKARYLNNLRLLDTQIERIVKTLERTGKMERTILLMVGDHGEAFGQHPENFTHSRASYAENLHVPALFYQPRLFPAVQVNETTSHVDLLPTLLEAMAISHSPENFQGESLFAQRRQRYQFSVGNENAISSIGPKRTKVLINFRKDRCDAYELESDPQEQKPLDCSDHPEQVKALLAYGKHQKKALVQLNDRIKYQRSQK